MIPTSTAIAGMRSCAAPIAGSAATRSATPTRWRTTRPTTTTVKTRTAPTTVRPSPVNSSRARSTSPADISGARRRPANSPTTSTASRPRVTGERTRSGSRPTAAAPAPRTSPSTAGIHAPATPRPIVSIEYSSGDALRNIARRSTTLPTTTSKVRAPPVISPAAPPARTASAARSAPCEPRTRPGSPSSRTGPPGRA